MIDLRGTNAHKAFVANRDGFVIDKTNERSHKGLKYRPYVRPQQDRLKAPKPEPETLGMVDACNGRVVTLEGMRKVSYPTPEHPQWHNLPQTTRDKILARMGGAA